MAENRRKSAADGKRPLAESGATEEEAAKRCDVCEGPLKPPVYQHVAASHGSQCSRQRRVACNDSGGGQGRSFADLAEEAINVVSQHLGYFKVPCPYKEYGCASSVASRDAAGHAAVCAHAPCACPEHAFLGSPAQLVQHLTAGQHDLSLTKFTYGKDSLFFVNLLEEPRKEKHLLVAEEDGAVFLLALGLGGHGQERQSGSGRAAVVCVRGNEDAGPAYRSSVVAQCLSLFVGKTFVLPSCSAPGEFDVGAARVSACMFSLHGEETKELHLRVCIYRVSRSMCAPASTGKIKSRAGTHIWRSPRLSRSKGDPFRTSTSAKNTEFTYA